MSELEDWANIESHAEFMAKIPRLTIQNHVKYLVGECTVAELYAQFPDATLVIDYDSSLRSEVKLFTVKIESDADYLARLVESYNIELATLARKQKFKAEKERKEREKYLLLKKKFEPHLIDKSTDIQPPASRNDIT